MVKGCVNIGLLKACGFSMLHFLIMITIHFLRPKCYEILIREENVPVGSFLSLFYYLFQTKNVFLGIFLSGSPSVNG